MSEQVISEEQQLGFILAGSYVRKVEIETLHGRKSLILHVEKAEGMMILEAEVKVSNDGFHGLEILLPNVIWRNA